MLTPDELIGLSLQEAIDLLDDNSIPYKYKRADRRKHRVEWDDVPNRWTLEIDDDTLVKRVRVSQAKPTES